MQIDPDKVKVVVSDKNTLDMNKIIWRKALGKDVDELVIAEMVTLLKWNTKIDPSIVKKKKDKKKKTENKTETVAEEKKEKSEENSQVVDKPSV